MLNRNFTQKINWVLDNLVPPVIRDSRVFMRLIIRLVYGSHTSTVLDFKREIPAMNEEQIDDLYREIMDAPVNGRETDLNSKCVRLIMDSISGESVLDAACGRGYMVKKMIRGGIGQRGWMWL